MKITGYQIREGIKYWTLLRDAAAKQFPDSLFAFQGELKPKPTEIIASFESAEQSLADLQTLQQWYNTQVPVRIDSQRMTLAAAVKRVGGATRIEKFWKGAIANVKKDRYGTVETLRSAASRDKDSVYEERQVTQQDALKFAEKAARVAGAYRSAIAQGNTVTVNLEEFRGFNQQRVEELLGRLERTETAVGEE
jgi:hypothetical protein